MRKEQDLLLRKAEESVRAARLLMDAALNEFAASRAYYAMFYVAQVFLLEQNLTFSKHSAVLAAFGERFVKTGIIPSEYHRFLLEAHETRNVADYDVGQAVSSAQAAEQIRRAESFLQVANAKLRA